MSYNQNSGLGRALLNMAHSLVPTLGRVMVVLDPDDTDEENYQRVQEVFKHDPNGKLRFYTNLESAAAAMESNNNDVLLIDANSTHVLSTTGTLTLTTNRGHFIGMDGGDRLVQQGAKIANATDDTDAFIFKNTGVRNSFRNLQFIQSSTNAAALTVGQFGGEGNLYKNCSFTFGVVDNLDGATTYEAVMGEYSGTFENCQFGVDTLLTSAARSIMLIDQVTSGQEFKSNIFKDCTWLGSSSDADMQAISMAAAGDILFTNHFIRPSFIASIDSAGGIACTKAVSTASGTTKGTVLISYPMVHGFNDIGINGTNNDGLFVFSHVPSALNITSAKPTTA